MKLQSWQTWKKKNNPQIYSVQDGTLGYKETIVPTLKAHGFDVTEENRDTELSPKQDALNHIDEDNTSEAVYAVWRHSQGYCSNIIVAYKEVRKKKQYEKRNYLSKQSRNYSRRSGARI